MTKLMTNAMADTPLELERGRLDLRLLEVFCRVCEEKSFSKAADSLGLTQPTISSHIKTFEGQVGACLLDRTGREAAPTQLGALVYEHGRRILDAKRALLADLDRTLNRLEGRLRLGASSIPGEHLLAPLIHDFRAAVPGIEICLTVRDTLEILECVESGTVEMGFVGARRPSEPALSFTEFAVDRLVLVAPATPEWAGVTEVALDRLCREPLVIREPGSGTRMVFEQRLGELGRSLRDLNVVAEMGSTTAVRHAVQAGLGLAVVSCLAIGEDVEANRLKVLTVPEMEPLERRFYVVTHARRVPSPLCKAFQQWLTTSNKAVG